MNISNIIPKFTFLVVIIFLSSCAAASLGRMLAVRGGVAGTVESGLLRGAGIRIAATDAVVANEALLVSRLRSIRMTRGGRMFVKEGGKRSYIAEVVDSKTLKATNNGKIIALSGTMHTVTARHLNVRTGPGVEYPKVNQGNIVLDEGEVVIVEEEIKTNNGTWLKIRIGKNQTGYISKRYTKRVKSGSKKSNRLEDEIFDEFRDEVIEDIISGSDEEEDKYATCSSCNGSGSHYCGSCRGSKVNTCFNCNGSKSTTCGSCAGDGYKNCSTCSAKGYYRVHCEECKRRGYSNCAECYGGGYEIGRRGRTNRKCHVCNGDGKRRCGYCKGAKYRTVTCTSCNGSKHLQCHTCRGWGSLSCGNCGATGVTACGACSHSGKVACNYCNGKGLIKR